MDEASWHFGTGQVEAEIQSLGGMLGPVTFKLGDRAVAPFAVAPWSDDESPEHAALPGLLKRLRGEWPCVPFGAEADRPELPADWQPQGAAEPDVVDPGPHGFSSNRHWQLAERQADGVVLEIAYPDEHAIARLVRRVRADAQSPALDFTLEIHARRDCRVPIGLHPTYGLPQEPRGLVLELGEDARAWTFPAEVEPGRTAFRPDQRDVSPGALALGAGGTFDVRALPPPGPSEDLVLLTGLGGRIALAYVQLGYKVVQSWDASHFPSCLLWISNRGRGFYPWSGRHRGLGVEPIAAPFDLGPATAQSGEDPLARAGVPTSVTLTAGVPLVTRYRIGVEAL